MYRLLSKLLVYKNNLGEDSILVRLGGLLKELDISMRADKEDIFEKERIISEIHSLINRMLSLAADYGFEGNLWHNYLAYKLAMAENPFSLSCEMCGAKQGSINILAKNDFKIFKELFD